MFETEIVGHGTAGPQWLHPCLMPTPTAITRSKLTIETLQQGVKHVQS